MPPDPQQSFRHPANVNYVPPRVELIDPLAWVDKTVPERRWMVNDWMPHGNVTLVSGDGGIGKSLITQQLLTSTALGRPWLLQATMHCKVLGIFCEDDADELHRRQAAINEHMDIGMADLGDMTLVSRVGMDNVLMDFEYGNHGKSTKFFEQLEELVDDQGAQLILLDAAHDFFGGNENARPQVRQFINLLRKLAVDHDATVALCAHPSLTGLATKTGLSGSTAWNNAVRSRLYLTRPDDDLGEPNRDARVLKVMKSNYARTGDEVPLRWHDGVFVRQDRPTGMLGTITRRSAEHAFLDGLGALLAKGHEPSFKIEARTLYAPKLMSGWPQVEGFGVKELAGAMQRLMATGEVVLAQTTEGPPSRRRTIIVPKDHPLVPQDGLHTPTDTTD